MTEMLSFGAGVNSVAMVVMLAEQGWHGPIVFADTGAEHPETYCYMEYFERKYLKPRGMEIIRVEPGSPYHKRSKLSLEDFCLEQGKIPLLFVRWCSGEWKRRPLHGWSDEHGYNIQLLGISADEPRRIRDDLTVRYPLVEANIHRPECIRIIQRAGLDVPRKSSCWFCPGQRIAEWRGLYMEHPELYERAIALEDNASERWGRQVTLGLDGVSLRQLVERRWQGQMQMDLSQWLPCACAL